MPSGPIHGCICTMGRAKQQATKRKTALLFLDPCRKSSKRNCGRGRLIQPADLLRYPGGSSSQRDLTLVLKRTELFCIQKRDKVFHWETSIRSLTMFGSRAKCKQNNDWSQQKTFHGLLQEQDEATFLSPFYFLLLLSIGSPWRPAKSASCAPHFSAHI